ncbi:unnamed protein product [Trichobilharzia regenti]|nr:unnamed protein product [Trichobilharzia regenti]
MTRSSSGRRRIWPNHRSTGIWLMLCLDWRCITTRAELPYRSRKKPWPQKKTGKARHGNRRTHIWINGGQCKGPRGPESFFSVLPYADRITVMSLLSLISKASSQLQPACEDVEDRLRHSTFSQWVSEFGSCPTYFSLHSWLVSLASYISSLAHSPVMGN